ncbi:hypothetical protein B1199_01165 [Pseudoalteromonas ulvae]|uniref:Uncharacterized protein n=1 Tax=Pseudoalteromonas ulvae TaxID=107327 RepID=A0A244CVW0_PSEDV|nr:hypothetical protein B1199_01165 [Pseudoalteromonas ulvae]
MINCFKGTPVKYIFLLISLIVTGSAEATAAKLQSGPVITPFGKHYQVDSAIPVSAQTRLKVVFDVSEQSGTKKENRYFNSLARFINMHVSAGVPVENIELALVVHGEAGYDLLNDGGFQKEYQRLNPSAPLISQLLSNNVKVYLCGQSAAFLDIKQTDLIDGVEVALSAMTAHAVLAQQGYTFNPF